MSATRDHRSDFNLIAIVEHFVFGHEIVAFDHQMRFDDEVQLTQEILDLLGAFDFDRSSWMAELDLHARIIGCAAGKRQEAKGTLRTIKANILQPLAVYLVPLA